MVQLVFLLAGLPGREFLLASAAAACHKRHRELCNGSGAHRLQKQQALAHHPAHRGARGRVFPHICCCHHLQPIQTFSSCLEPQQTKTTTDGTFAAMFSAA